MQLEVEPSDLQEFSAQVGRAADDVKDGMRYVDQHAAIDWSEEGVLLRLFLGAHKAVTDDVHRAFERLDTVLRACRNELARASTYYRVTDIDVARRMDSARPAGHR